MSGVKGLDGLLVVYRQIGGVKATAAITMVYSYRAWVTLRGTLMGMVAIRRTGGSCLEFRRPPHNSIVLRLEKYDIVRRMMHLALLSDGEYSISLSHP